MIRRYIDAYSPKKGPSVNVPVGERNFEQFEVSLRIASQERERQVLILLLAKEAKRALLAAAEAGSVAGTG